MEAFTFGEPESVLAKRGWLMDYLHCYSNGKWYEPPVDFLELATTFDAAVHHSSPLYVKRNMLSSLFITHDLLSLADFEMYVMNFMIMGNAYIQSIKNRLGSVLKLRPLPTLNTRVGDDLNSYFFLTQKQIGGLDEKKFDADEIYCFKNYSVKQEIYGVPEYIAAINSALLNEAATIFRRRYYKNGSHAGFILYLSDEKIDQKDVDSLREALKNSKGIGNFKNLFLHSAGGDKDGIKLIPISEVAAKDEFANIKNTTRDDALAAHRVPPQILGILPGNVGGFGDVGKAMDSFYKLEIKPLQRRLAEINKWLGIEVIRWQKYKYYDPSNEDES